MEREKRLLFAIVALDLLGFGMVIPQLGPYAHALGAPEWLVGVLFATYSAMQFLFAPVWGSLSDQVGRRPILMVSLAGSVIGYLLFAAANSVAMLFASRLIAGIAAANISVAQAYLADITPPSERAGAMGLVGAAFGVGFVLGPALGGLLGRLGGIHAVGFGAAMFSALALLGAWRFLPEPSQRQSSHPLSRWATLHQVWRNRPLLLCIALFFFATFAIANLQFSLPLFLPLRWHWGVEETGWRVGVLLSFAGLLMGALQGVAVGQWAKRYGEARLVISGMGWIALPSVGRWHSRPSPASSRNAVPKKCGEASWAFIKVRAVSPASWDRCGQVSGFTSPPPSPSGQQQRSWQSFGFSVGDCYKSPPLSGSERGKTASAWQEPSHRKGGKVRARAEREFLR
jgi:DHA1 family tetracycline resistance protein-like MFS transporter